jgi:hypothetical protein
MRYATKVLIQDGEVFKLSFVNNSENYVSFAYYKYQFSVSSSTLLQLYLSGNNSC